MVLNFVDSSEFSDLAPSYPVVSTPSGISKAHTIDILSSKLSALASRRAVRDFLDVAAAAQDLGGCLIEASKLYVDSPLIRERSLTDLARTLKNYPFQVELGLAEDVPRKIATFVSELFVLSSNQRTDNAQSKANENDLKR